MEDTGIGEEGMGSTGGYKVGKRNKMIPKVLLWACGKVARGNFLEIILRNYLLHHLIR